MNDVDFHLMGPLQTRIMRLFWSKGLDAKLTIKDIQKALNQKKNEPELAYTTFLTVCRNLVKRKYLNQFPSGRSHSFAINITESWYQQQACLQFVDDVFDGQVTQATAMICKAFNERR